MEENTGIDENALLHPEAVAKVEGQMPDDSQVYQLADLYKIFGDSTRVKILSALEIHELCVGDLATLLGLTSSAISHQLRILRHANLVFPRREGKETFYSLADDHVRAILEKGLEHINEL